MRYLIFTPVICALVATAEVGGAAPPEPVVFTMEFRVNEAPWVPVTVVPEGRIVRVGDPVWLCEQLAVRRWTGSSGATMTGFTLACGDGRSTVNFAVGCSLSAPDTDAGSLLLRSTEQTTMFHTTCKTTAPPPPVAARSVSRQL